MGDLVERAWLEELRADGPDAAAAQADLREVLRRGLHRALRGWAGVDEATIEDLTQEALLRVLDRLDSFRGESRFTTWAMAIAVRLAFTELRHARWRDVSLEVLTGGGGAGPPEPVDPMPGPEQQSQRQAVLGMLRRVVDRDLTDRQRTAIVAELKGMPQAEIARQLGISRNALYKLGHDARTKLKRGLLAAGITEEEVRVAFDA